MSDDRSRMATLIERAVTQGLTGDQLWKTAAGIVILPDDDSRTRYGIAQILMDARVDAARGTLSDRLRHAIDDLANRIILDNLQAWPPPEASTTQEAPA